MSTTSDIPRRQLNWAAVATTFARVVYVCAEIIGARSKSGGADKTFGSHYRPTVKQ